MKLKEEAKIILFPKIAAEPINLQLSSLFYLNIFIIKDDKLIAILLFKSQIEKKQKYLQKLVYST